MELVIRFARSEDGKAVSRIYAPFIASTPVTFEEQAVDSAAMWGRIEQTLAMYPFLVAEVGGAVVGYAYGSAHHARASYRWSVNVSVYIAVEFQRRGIGRALYAKLLGLLKEQGFVMAYGGITLPNAGSVRLHESCGFTLVGIYHNAGYKLGCPAPRK